MKTKKMVYETLWVQVDKEKKYEHGWGFVAPLVEFPQDSDPAWCSMMCAKHLSNEEFECIGATPRALISGNFSFEYPKDEKEFSAWKEKQNSYAISA